MDKHKRDMRLGSQSEKEIHDYLETFFDKLLNTKDNIDMGCCYEFDKYNNTYMIEIKTRRIKHDKFESLFFGENKFKKGETLLKANPNLKIYYLWRCTDGVYGWLHNSTPYRRMKRGRRDRCREEINDCIDILQEYIKPLNNLL